LSPIRAGRIIARVLDHPPEPTAPPSGGASASPGLLARLARGVLELLQTVVVAALLFFAVNLVTARIRVEGSSMEPTLHNGELVVVYRLAYRWETPTRGDIVVFRFPLDPERRFIKRIIGLPGDSISVRDGQVWVNGEPLDEPYIASPPRYSGEWEVQAGEVFVLGDNRNNSSDSQNWGALPLHDVIGKAVLVYWPPEQMGLIPHTLEAVAAGG
jgi:signal peptidase I